MNSVFSRALVIIAGAAAAATAAQAEIYYAAVAKTVGYTQTSNAAPTDADSWFFIAGVYSDVPGELTGAELHYYRPPVVTESMYEAVPTAYLFYSTQFDNKATLDAVYPATYYTVVARAEGPLVINIQMPNDLYPAVIPSFTGDTYDRLQSWDASAPFTGTVSSFVPTAGTNTGYTNISLVKEGVGGVMSITLAPNETDFELPAGVLDADAQYSIGVLHVNAVESPSNIPETLVSAEFSRGTVVYFQTATEPTVVPGDMNCDGVVNNFDIDPFVMALIDPTAYAANYPTCSAPRGDVDASGALNNFDIDPFVACVLAGGCP